MKDDKSSPNESLKQFNKDGMGGIAKDFNYSGNHPSSQKDDNK